MLKINTLDGHERMSTQELLMSINKYLAAGETDFVIEASGQHDIGGPLWHPDGRKITFTVTNAGQRLGAMCLANTEVVAEGSVSADVGWLNAGGKIIVKGDAGDTAGHCASSGRIYIGGRSGTRSGSLMKHDPLYTPPELWVLKNVGSFSFEFMSGGIAVVCGYDCDDFVSTLGERSCVGMVGGIVYFRGQASGYADNMKIDALDGSDIEYLRSGMTDFLQSLDRQQLMGELCDWSQWHKITPVNKVKELFDSAEELAAYRCQEWVSGGIFSDVCNDDFVVNSLVMTGLYRLRVPVWHNEQDGDRIRQCSDCKLCLRSCPQTSITRKGTPGSGWEYSALADRCIGCGVCAATCPRKIWRLADNPAPVNMYYTK